MKKATGFKIDTEILKKFNSLAKENAVNKSKWLENIMMDYIKEVKNK